MRPHLSLTALILLAAFALVLRTLDDASLWYDEAWSAYAVAAPAPDTYEPPRGLRATLRTTVNDARADLTTTLARVRADVHPPLYFLALDGWTWLAGESVFSLRYLSLMAGLLALATTATLGRQLFGGGAGVYAAGLLGASMLWTYYAAEARMYAPLIALAAASTLAYVRLAARPTVWRAVLHGVVVALGVYTHYTAALVPLAHGIHALSSRRPRTLFHWMGGGALAVLLYAPWLPIALAQFTNNPGGPLATPEPTNWTTVWTLVGYFTSGRWLPYAALAAVALVDGRRRGRVALTVLWLVVVPGTLFAVNAWVFPAYNPRYTLAALPALALLAAGGISVLAARLRFGGVLAALTTLALMAGGLTAYDGSWGAKPPYREVVAAFAAERDPLAPLLGRLEPYDPFTYHAREAGQLGALLVNTAGNDGTPETAVDLAGRFGQVPDVWLAQPTNHPATWHTVAALLSQGRTVTYRDGVQNLVVYRLSLSDDGDPLALNWGTLDGTPVAAYRGELVEDVSAVPGESVCMDPAVEPLAGAIAVSVTLARGYNEVVDQWHGGPGEEACVRLPEDAAGDYALYLGVHHPVDGAPFPVYDGDVWWGNWIVTTRVTVTP
jgi:mannosyltransferase